MPELTQNLFYNASCYVSVMKNRKSTINKEDEMYKSFSQFSHLLKELPFRDKMGALINNLNKQQFTMTKNHLKLNFYKRFSKYLELRTGETRKSIIYKWCKDIYDEKYNGKNYFILSMKQWKGENDNVFHGKTHYRNYTDIDYLKTILALKNFEIIFIKEDLNFAEYKDENPICIRVICKKSAF